MMDVLDRLKKWSFGIEPDSVKVEILMCDFKQIVAEMDRLTIDNARLTALCDEYRGEVAALKAELTDAKSISAATIDHQGSLLEAATGRAESAESALSRARAEGMEEGLEKAATITDQWIGCDLLARAIRAEACRLAEQANKGEKNAKD